MIYIYIYMIIIAYVQRYGPVWYAIIWLYLSIQTGRVHERLQIDQVRQARVDTSHGQTGQYLFFLSI